MISRDKLNLDFTYNFADQAHNDAGNTTWDGSRYIGHPNQVKRFTQLTTGLLVPEGDLERFSGYASVTHDRLYDRAKTEGMEDEHLYHAALLHDVVEDTKLTLEDLIEIGYPLGTVRLVDAVSKRDGEASSAFFRRILSYNSAAVLILRLADRLHNLDPSRVPIDRQESFGRKVLQYCDEFYVMLGRDQAVADAIIEPYPSLKAAALQALNRN